MNLFYWNSLKSDTGHGSMFHIDGPLMNSVFDFTLVFKEHPMLIHFILCKTDVMRNYLFPYNHFFHVHH